MSQERQFPHGPLPVDVEQSITDIISEVGLSITEKILRRRLETKYEIEFTSHSDAVKSLVKKVLTLPQFQKELVRVHKEKKEGPIGGKGKKRSKSSPEVQKKEKAKKPDDYPKAALSAYMIFGGEAREQIKVENPDLKITEIAKKIGEKWGALSEKEKEKYKSLADADKVRFEKDMEAYKARGGEVLKRGSKKDSKRSKKDPNRPKKALSAYMFFASDYRKKNPGLSAVECMRGAGSAWKELSDEAKKPFEAMAAKDKERHDSECAEKGTSKGEVHSKKEDTSSEGSVSESSDDEEY